MASATTRSLPSPERRPADEPATRVLLVTDAALDREALTLLLEVEGYDVTTATSGEGAVRAIEHDGAELILLDAEPSGERGLTLCRMLRGVSTVPIIMLAAAGGEADTVAGLDAGADDYVTRPFSARELVARIHSVLRRSAPATGGTPGVLEAGPVVIDVDAHVVLVRGEPVRLPLREFDLLETLVREAGRALTRKQLIDRVWGVGFSGDAKTLDAHIKRLRAKLERDPSNPAHLITLRGLGYKFEA